MGYIDCFRRRFKCEQDLAKLQAEIATLRAHPPRWSAFEGLPPIQQVGRRVQHHEIAALWREQLGTVLDVHALTPQAGRCHYVDYVYPKYEPWAVPRQIMQTVMDRCGHIKQIPYTRSRHDCQNYANRFCGEWQGAPYALGYYNALVGQVALSGHRQNIYLCSDDMQFYLVEMQNGAAFCGRQRLALPEHGITRLII
jgi:hypothetical protein